MGLQLITEQPQITEQPLIMEQPPEVAPLRTIKQLQKPQQPSVQNTIGVNTPTGLMPMVTARTPV